MIIKAGKCPVSDALSKVKVFNSRLDGDGDGDGDSDSDSDSERSGPVSVGQGTSNTRRAHQSRLPARRPLPPYPCLLIFCGPT